MFVDETEEDEDDETNGEPADKKIKRWQEGIKTSQIERTYLWQ